jgi:cell division septum initiation protein DivIVA
MEGLMEHLKMSFTGKYRAEDVDMLLLKIRSDYEKCLKEQKERIVNLRDENRELQTVVEKYRSNEKYIIDTIARAEETAQSIIKEAEASAEEIVGAAEKKEIQLRSDVEVNCQRLYKLKRASEAIFRAVTKVMGEHIEAENILIQSNIRPIAAFSRPRMIE